jgi:hypothetical protein
MRRVLALALPAGDRASVLRVYEEFVDRMRRELDVAPSAETERAADALRRAAGAAERERSMETPNVGDVQAKPPEAIRPEEITGPGPRRDVATSVRSAGTPPRRSGRRARSARACPRNGVPTPYCSTGIFARSRTWTSTG